MPRDADEYDFFVSYAHADNAGGWITGFVEQLLAEHRRFAGGRKLSPFFDNAEIRSLDDWQHRRHAPLTHSQMFLAFISPNYFASEWCRREWQTWMDIEIARQTLAGAIAPIYIVEVADPVGGTLDEHEVARRVADLCTVPPPHESFVESTASVVEQWRRRQFNAVQPFYDRGLVALRRDDLRRLLTDLTRDFDVPAKPARLAAASPNTVPPYNKRFSGRLDELLELRTRLTDAQAGVICGVHGLGGIGKSELTYTYAHAFANAYPGGRLLVPCEGQSDLRQALLPLGDVFRTEISDDDRKTVATYFAAVAACLRERLDRQGHILLLLDNVTDPALLARQQTDVLTALGPKLHLLATTRLLPPSRGYWLTLGELPEADALELLEKHRPFASAAERAAGGRIVRRLGGFALAVELVAAWLLTHPGSTYAQIVEGLGLGDLEQIAASDDVELRRHNHQRRLSAVLSPVLHRLRPAERRTMEYAALLPPDQVPLPWLKTLVVAEFRELAQPGRRSDPWDDLCGRLARLALFTRSGSLEADWRIVCIHRLVQDVLCSQMPAKELAARQKAVVELVKARDAALEATTRWEQARWELEPLEGLAVLWADADYAGASWLLNQVGQRWRAVAEWTRAEPLIRRALAIDEQSLGSEHSNVAIRLCSLAALLQATNRLGEAEPLLRRALAIDEQSYGHEHPHVARDLNNLALLLKATNRRAEAESLLRRALVIDEHAYGPEHPDVAKSLNNLAQLLKATNRLGEAEPLMRRALAIDEQSYGTEHPDVARDLSNLAALLYATNRLAEAEPLIRRALAIDEQAYGPEHPHVAIRLDILAQVLQATNRVVEAEPLIRRALAIDEQCYGLEHPHVAIHLSNLALLLQVTNRVVEAEPLIRRALAIDEQSYGTEHPDVARDLNNLAALLQATNRLGEAEPLMRRALAIDEQSYGTEHPEVAIRLNTLAQLLQNTNRPKEAEPLMRRVLAIFRKSLGEDHPNVATALNNLARLLQATNRLAEAEPLMRSMLEILLQFTRVAGHPHPHLQSAIWNYSGLLSQMGRSEAEVSAQLKTLAHLYGLSFGD